MMRIRKGALHEKWSPHIRTAILLKVFDGPFSYEGSGVELFGNACSPGLWSDVRVSRELVVRASKQISIGIASLEPTVVMADGFITMPNRKFHMIKTIIGERRFEVRLSFPRRWQFL